MANLHPEWAAHTAVATELAETRDRHARELADLVARHGQEMTDIQARFDATKAVLIERMPEGEPICMAEGHPPIIKRIGSDFQPVVHRDYGSLPPTRV